jgi:hypothetical protein
MNRGTPMTDRTFDDVPQHIKEKFTPKLTKLFNKGAKLAEKLLKEEPEKLSYFDKAQVTSLVGQSAVLYQRFKSAGGNDDDLELIIEEALKNSEIHAMADKLNLNL